MEDLEEEDIRVTINKGAIRVTIQIQYVRERGSRAAGGPARRAWEKREEEEGGGGGGEETEVRTEECCVYQKVTDDFSAIRRVH